MKAMARTGQLQNGWASPTGTGLSAALKPRRAPGFPPSGSLCRVLDYTEHPALSRRFVR